MAASAMLLTRPMCRKLLRGFSSAPGCTRGQLRPDRRSGPGYFGFKKTGMADSPLRAAASGVLAYQSRLPFSLTILAYHSRLHCRAQGLIEVGQDVVDMFDPNAQA